MAAGNTLEEALIQAACEVFERYTQIQIIKPERRVPSIDKNSLKKQPAEVYDGLL
jgi:ribosomal protein S12 methylthiotransferase accessory factor